MGIKGDRSGVSNGRRHGIRIVWRAKQDGRAAGNPLDELLGCVQFQRDVLRAHLR